MNHLRSLRATAAGLGLAMVLVACGQKPGVHVEGNVGGQPLAGGQQTGGLDSSGGGTDTSGGFDNSGGGGLDTSGGGTDASGGGGLDGSGGGDPATSGVGDSGGGTSADPNAGGGAGGGGDASGGAGGGDAGGGAGGGGAAGGGDAGGGSDGGGGGGATTQKRSPQGSDQTGVTNESIKLAIHAPVTGAAPLPSTSFEKARDLYWRYVTEKKGEKVVGRSKVEVEFKDDKYDPNSARQACRELASKAFMSVGGGGTDQIQACGQFAAVAKTPYFSAGVTEKGLEGNPWYFASSATYKQQGPLLAQYVKKNFGNKKVAAVVTDTPNFDDAIAGWEAGVQQQGLNYYKTLRHPKGDTSWYTSFAQDLKGQNVDVVFILSSPVDYIRFAQKGNEQGYKPQYVGVGITKGLNAVLGSGCPQVDGGIFFSPFPGLDVIDKLDPEFNKAAQQLGMPNDDLALALWGIAKQQHELFKRYENTFGQKLTREDFRALTEAQSKIETGVFPNVGYSPQNHFGGQAVHVLQADCGSKKHKTLASFASKF